MDGKGWTTMCRCITKTRILGLFALFCPIFAALHVMSGDSIPAFVSGIARLAVLYTLLSHIGEKNSSGGPSGTWAGICVALSMMVPVLPVLPRADSGLICMLTSRAQLLLFMVTDLIWLNINAAMTAQKGIRGLMLPTVLLVLLSTALCTGFCFGETVLEQTGLPAMLYYIGFSAAAVSIITAARMPSKERGSAVNPSSEQSRRPSGLPAGQPRRDHAPLP